MHYSLSLLFILLGVLIFLSAFFALSEIGMMSLNTYRLRHLVRSKDRRAERVAQLLEKPEKLLAVVLIGNTCANIVASAIATLIGAQLYGEIGVAVATGILAILVIIVAEMAPKTIAALYPQPIALSCSWLLQTLLLIFSPIVWSLNKLVHYFFKPFGINTETHQKELLSADELRTIVYETGNRIPNEHKRMLLSILDLEKVTVDDIMVQHNDIVGINIEASWPEIMEQLETTRHTRLPVYEGSMDKVIGMIHMRNLLNGLLEKNLDKQSMESLIEPCYFVPQGTGLHQQLLNFQQIKKRTAFIVDEYGDIQGLVTLEDILEEIVGEFTTDMAAMQKDIHPQSDGSFLVDGSAMVRDLNKSMGWKLPLIGPRTLSGLVIEYLGFIPPAQSCVLLADRYRIEIIQIKDNMIKTIRIEIASKSPKTALPE